MKFNAAFQATRNSCCALNGSQTRDFPPVNSSRTRPMYSQLRVLTSHNDSPYGCSVSGGTRWEYT